METQRTVEPRRADHLPPGLMSPALPAGGRWKKIQAQARRRRWAANALVVGTSGAVLALAVLFNHLLSR